MPIENVLEGGNAGGPAVRVGSTVRKRWTAATPSVFAFLTAIRAAGVDAPAPLGRDDSGRQVLEYVPGQLAMNTPPLTVFALARVGAMVRELHDAAASFIPHGDSVWQTAIPTPGAELVCHNDLAPWNLIVGERWVFIDWDAAAPSTRLWDLAYAAHAFTLGDTGLPADVAGRRLHAFVDGYGADEEMRKALPGVMVQRVAAMHELLRSSHERDEEPWAWMYRDGHGAHWQRALAYVTVHAGVWARWLGDEGSEGLDG